MQLCVHEAYTHVELLLWCMEFVPSMVHGIGTLRVQFQVFSRSESERKHKTAQRVQTLASTEA